MSPPSDQLGFILVDLEYHSLRVLFLGEDTLERFRWCSKIVALAYEAPSERDFGMNPGEPEAELEHRIKELPNPFSSVLWSFSHET